MENTIYTGKYKNEENRIDQGDVIELPESKLKVLNWYHRIFPGETVVDDRITLVVVDGDFWPYIGRFSRKEAAKLRDALDQMISYKGRDQQSVEISNG